MSAEDKKVSVIIPVYNSGNKIIKCVESLIFGVYKNIEVLLIDDCSTDDSYQYCEKLAGKFNNVYSYKNKSNTGVSFTRNRGIELSKGDYLVFVDSDDWVSGEYISSLIVNSEAETDALVICGILFINEVEHYRTKYVWDESSREKIILGKKDYFSLIDKFYIQSPCNKLFNRNIIINYCIKFDVNQTMGEDFQFVLDYLSKLYSDHCVVINRALYYYVRYSDTSLMGQFGLEEKNREFIYRLKQLKSIIGSDDTQTDKIYNKAVENTLNSYAYNICRNANVEKKEKIEAIESVMQDGNAENHYRHFIKVVKKEALFNKLKALTSITVKVKNRLIDINCKRIIKKNKKRLKAKDFSIISQNCIAGVFYHDMGMQFLTPTVNLFFKTDDFIKFVLNLKYYLRCELVMQWGEEYPIGKLDDIKIYFMHYSTCSEAEKAWNRRKQRINFDKIFVLCTDMEGFNETLLEQWKKIKYPKLLMSTKRWKDESCWFLEKYSRLECLPDLIPKREFYSNDQLVSFINARR